MALSFQRKVQSRASSANGIPLFQGEREKATAHINTSNEGIAPSSIYKLTEATTAMLRRRAAHAKPIAEAMSFSRVAQNETRSPRDYQQQKSYLLIATILGLIYAHDTILVRVVVDRATRPIDCGISDGWQCQSRSEAKPLSTSGLRRCQSRSPPQ